MLNDYATALCSALASKAQRLRIAIRRDVSGTRLVDCGIGAPGGLEAGRWLAEVCLAGLAKVDIVPGRSGFGSGERCYGPTVATYTDHPVAACMASQYAGWQIAEGDYFAMGSGPMRAAAGREEIFEKIGNRETPDAVVGVLECGKLPPTEVCRMVAEKCGVAPDALTLLVAPTSSIAGTIQVVARTVETALHKLFELGFDIKQVESGYGTAPLPPVAADNIEAIGRTNDAVLYGGEVTLWVRGDDDELEKFGPQVPSASSTDFGEPFCRIFEKYDRDFYKIDPLLFSPAAITLVNLQTGNSFSYGVVRPDVISASFGTHGT